MVVQSKYKVPIDAGTKNSWPLTPVLSEIHGLKIFRLKREGLEYSKVFPACLKTCAMGGAFKVLPEVLRNFFKGGTSHRSKFRGASQKTFSRGPSSREITLYLD